MIFFNISSFLLQVLRGKKHPSCFAPPANMGVGTISQTYYEEQIRKAIETDDKELFNHLLVGMDLAQVNREGETLLYKAVCCNRVDMACNLLYREANVNQRNFHHSKGSTALHVAVRYKSLELCRLLVELGHTI